MKWIWKSQSQKEERTMTYNTRIYNYANLHSKDKQIVQAQLLMFETIEDLITEYTYSKEACTNILEIISFLNIVNKIISNLSSVYSNVIVFVIYRYINIFFLIFPLFLASQRIHRFLFILCFTLNLLF